MFVRPARSASAVPALAPALVLVLGLAACSGGSDERVAAPTPTVTATPSASPSSTPTTTPSVTPSASPSSRPTVDAVFPTATSDPGVGEGGPAAPPTVDPSRPPVETAPPAGQPSCKAADLTVNDADAVITAGSVQELFVVRTSGPDCQLQGYPDVVLRGAGDAPLAVTYTQGGGGLPALETTVVTLSRSTSLSFRIATPRTGGCVSASSISVRLPGTDGDLVTTTSLSVCQSKAGISPVGRIRADS